MHGLASLLIRTVIDTKGGGCWDRYVFASCGDDYPYQITIAFITSSVTYFILFTV